VQKKFDSYLDSKPLNENALNEPKDVRKLQIDLYKMGGKFYIYPKPRQRRGQFYLGAFIHTWIYKEHLKECPPKNGFLKEKKCLT